MSQWNYMKTYAAYLACAFACACCLQTSAQPVTTSGEAPTGERLVVVISDTHMGLGRDAQSQWIPGEDFRWPKALSGFLDHVSQIGNDSVDLVVAGDIFEMWQPPAHIPCKGVSADLGCSEAEITQIAKIVAREHAHELGLLAKFAARGNNRVHLIPGNHDAALLMEPVWQQFAPGLHATDGRVSLERAGLWASSDGRIVIEHGHQIGADVNRFEGWPGGIARSEDGTTYAVQPWGERFVQQIFNEQETQYPIVDNLSPESAGVRYRMADRGTWGTAQDLARFLAFNLFETSVRQKGVALGELKPGDDWDVAYARTKGYQLFAAALGPDDPFAKELAKPDTAAATVRASLAELAHDSQRLSDDEVRSLCAQAANKAAQGWQTCRRPEMGALVQGRLYPKESIMRSHLRQRLNQFKRMQVFVYGHTHQIEVPQRIVVGGSIAVDVANTGAFQRLIDEEGFLSRIQTRGWTPAEGLRRMAPEDLAPCYGVVLIPTVANQPTLRVQMWRMPEDAVKGELVGPGDARCR